MRTLEQRRAYQREYMKRRRRARPEIREAERVRAADHYWSDPVAARASAKAWRLANPEAVAASRQKRETPERVRLANRKFYLTHIEEMRERSRLRRQTHPEDKRRGARKRKAKRRGTAFDLTPEQIAAILASGCAFCGTYNSPTLAHDVPVSAGGATTLENTFCLCGSCNSRMWTRTRAQVEQLMAVGAW